jgi:hypothetical protein
MIVLFDIVYLFGIFLITWPFIKLED